MEQRSKHFKKREAILNCLRSTTCHPSAEWVHAQLKAEYPEISLGTVYRNLALFKEQGLIISVGTVNGVERFDANTEPHVHFICDTCDAVIDLHQFHTPDTLSAEVEDTTKKAYAGGLVAYMDGHVEFYKNLKEQLIHFKTGAVVSNLKDAVPKNLHAYDTKHQVW